VVTTEAPAYLWHRVPHKRPELVEAIFGVLGITKEWMTAGEIAEAIPGISMQRVVKNIDLMLTDYPEKLQIRRRTRAKKPVPGATPVAYEYRMPVEEDEKLLRREWGEARKKLADEGVCRVCGTASSLEAAHVAGRKYDERVSKNKALVHPDDIVPLCRDHHTRFDHHEFDLLPYLSIPEQVRAVSHLGIYGALRRLSGREAMS